MYIQGLTRSIPATLFNETAEGERRRLCRSEGEGRPPLLPQPIVFPYPLGEGGRGKAIARRSWNWEAGATCSGEVQGRGGRGGRAAEGVLCQWKRAGGMAFRVGQCSIVWTRFNTWPRVSGQVFGPLGSWGGKGKTERGRNVKLINYSVNPTVTC